MRKKYTVAFFISALALVGVVGAATYARAETPVVNHPRMVLDVGPEGHVLLRGTVQSTGSSTVAVKSWGGVWTIKVGSDTEILPRVVGGASDLSYFQVGDFVGVSGFVATDADWTVNARVLRDWTTHKETNQDRKQNQKEFKDIKKEAHESGIGRIFEGRAETVATSTFTFSTKGTSSPYTVNVGVGVKVINRSWLTIPFSSIQAGDRIRIFGTASAGVITPEVVRDVSIPR